MSIVSMLWGKLGVRTASAMATGTSPRSSLCDRRQNEPKEISYGLMLCLVRSTVSTLAAR